MTADRKAGQSIGSVFPHLITQVCVYGLEMHGYCMYIQAFIFNCISNRAI